MNCKCNKCGMAKCGCADSALTTPCSYTDCGPTGERCVESFCAECITWCGPATEVTDGSGNTFVVNEGERMEQIIQRVMLVLANGLGACTSSNGFHAPWNVYFGKVNSNDIEIVWASENIDTSTIEVELDTAVNSGGWVSQAAISPGVYSFKVINLVPNTGYKFRLKATSTTGDVCYSVVVYKSTLP